MNPDTLANIAAKQASKMNPEQAGEGLMMGVGMFAGRVDSFLKDYEFAFKQYPAGTLSLFVSQYTNKGKIEVRFDIMSKGSGSEYKHVKQHRTAEILGIPQLFEPLVLGQLRKNILESFNLLAGDTGLPETDLQFHIERSPGQKYNLKLCLRHKGKLVMEIDPEKAIEKSKSEFNTQENGNSNK